MREETKRMIEYFSSLIESRDLSAEYHCHHVRRFTEIILEKVIQYFPEYHLTKEDWELISCAASMHDAGKIAISDKILQKPGRLTNDEFLIMKNHTLKGKKIFERILEMMDEKSEDYKFFTYCAEVCMYHHERYDGDGYPKGLKGEEIPISAQVVGLADAYDVLLSERIYKAAFTKEEAFEMIIDGDCGMFSPKLIEIFQMLRMELEEVLE